jgi:hypothetical protein
MSGPLVSIGPPQKHDGSVLWWWCVWIESGVPYAPEAYGFAECRKAAMDAAKRWLAVHGFTKPRIDKGHSARWWQRRTGAPSARDARAPEPVRVETLHREYLKTLGLKAMPVDERQLKLAWQRTAFKVHPDAGGNDAAFVKAKTAYEHLQRFVGGAT